MDDSFILYSNTAIDTGACFGTAACYAAAALIRDLRSAVGSSSGSATEIRLAYGTNIAAEEYIISFPSTSEMLISASDDLGAAYGLYRVSSEFLGIGPMSFWSEAIPAPRQEVVVPIAEYSSPEYRVRFRGWYINDEVLIDAWNYGNDPAEKWRIIFETVLRCGGNMVIPGTDKNSAVNRELAWDMGLWVTHHHSEPLGAEMFARIYPGEQASYSKNPQLFVELWKQAILEQNDRKVIWSLGFRGQGDRPFWMDDPTCDTPEHRGALIARAIIRQMEMVRRYVPDAVFCTNLYGELMVLYKNGYLKLPDSIIKVWANNGFGCMVSRRQGNDNPRIPALPTVADTKPHGVYFHCSFHDLQASNHLTMSPNSARFLANQLEQAVEAGANEYLIVNCGSVKPHVYPLDLVQTLWREKVASDKHLAAYAKAYYPGYDEHMMFFLEQYALTTAKYGRHEDEHAGEQIWHHPVRELLCAWIAGKTNETLESLIWLTGQTSYAEQIDILCGIAQTAQQAWAELYVRAEDFCNSLSENESVRFHNDYLVQVIIQYSGLMETLAFCESYRLYKQKDYVHAFMQAGTARGWCVKAVQAMERASQGRWLAFYDNDCLMDIRLTRDCMKNLMEYLRIMGDGKEFKFNYWEKRFLDKFTDVRW